MHEYALAEATVARAAEIARERNIATVGEVVIGLGELQRVDRDAFEFGLEANRRTEPLLETARFVFVADPASCTCRACGHQWDLADSLQALPEDDRESVHLLPEMVHLYVGCPACGSPDYAVVGGRGVSIVAVNA